MLEAQQYALAGCEASTSTLKTELNIRVLYKELKGLSQQWRDLGTLLDLTDEELDKVESQCSSDPLKCTLSILKVWLSKEGPPPTWELILDAVDCLDQNLADNLKQRYLMK